MINEIWEQVADLSDALRIISETISSEFAQGIEEIFIENECKIEGLEMNIAELRLKEEHLKDINRQLDSLENYINENQDKTDYMRGMEKAYTMIMR